MRLEERRGRWGSGHTEWSIKAKKRKQRDCGGQEDQLV